MTKGNYITDRKLTGGMINSRGLAHQDLIAIKYAFDNMDKGLERIAFEGMDDFAIYYKDGDKVYCQCKINLLDINFVSSICNACEDDEDHVLIGSGMDDDFRCFNQRLIRYKNACFEENNQEKINDDLKEFCAKYKC